MSIPILVGERSHAKQFAQIWSLICKFPSLMLLITAHVGTYACGVLWVQLLLSESLLHPPGCLGVNLNNSWDIFPSIFAWLVIGAVFILLRAENAKTFMSSTTQAAVTKDHRLRGFWTREMYFLWSRGWKSEISVPARSESWESPFLVAACQYLCIHTQGKERERGSKPSPDSPNGSNLIPEGCTLMTSPNCDYLLKAHLLIPSCGRGGRIRQRNFGVPQTSSP